MFIRQFFFLLNLYNYISLIAQYFYNIYIRRYELFNILFRYLIFTRNNYYNVFEFLHWKLDIIKDKDNNVNNDKLEKEEIKIDEKHT